MRFGAKKSATHPDQALTQMFGDAGVVQDVDHVGVDVRQVFEGHEPAEPGGTRSLMELQQDLLFGERGGSQLHPVLLKDLVDEAALDHRKQQLLQHQHGEEHRAGAHDVGKRAAFLGAVLVQPLDQLAQHRLHLLTEPKLSRFDPQQGGHVFDFA